MRNVTLRHLILVLLAANLAVLVANPFPVTAQGQVYAVVTAATVNVRSGPGLDFSIVGDARANDSFPVLGRAHGSNRVWYKIQLPSGGTAWISERVVNIVPSPDSVPWLGDNPTKIPLVMDCGSFPPVLFVGSHAQVTRQGGLVLTTEPGLGKAQAGSVAFQESVLVVDGPFCTRLAADFYQIQWLVQTDSGVKGYLLEGRPDGKGNYVPYTAPGAQAAFNGGSEAERIDRPVTVLDSDIAEVTSIFQSVQNDSLSRTEVKRNLQQVVEKHGKDTLAWIVRRVPIYDGKTQHWESFARYEDQSLMEFDTNSELDSDPVTVTVQILYGDYGTTDEVLALMGGGEAQP